DPDDDGEPPFNTRNTISVFGDGLLQLLAQEITEELQATRDEAAAAAAASPGTTVTRELRSKGTSYGSLAVVSDGGEPRFDLTQVEGIDPDLVVRPFGSKGTVPNVRTITAGPAQGGLGMQPEELVWKREDGGADADPDGDGVERELSVGDITAMTIYTASQETPTDVERLADLGWVAPPSDAELATLAKGRETFAAAGCADCHIPEMHLGDAVFEEPTLRGNGNYFDPDLAERDPGYDPERPVRFDLLTEAQAPRAEPHPDGGAIVRLYGDLKRHAMGRQLEEPAGPSGSTLAVRRPLLHDGERVRVPADVFLTSELWGVGNTGPWLHDGRAGTLREAVLLHGEDDPPAPGEPGRSEAQESRDAFRALAPQDQDALVSFLLSLRTFAPEGD
ncbi:MAG: di-heme oxidoredictase family protein, partial [Thermoanaerobaculia bacterium]|nr:di-heme oxidoredictase family protein [Thermoanaerobaculia bacterium]